jgi:hypothetical protein
MILNLLTTLLSQMPCLGSSVRDNQYDTQDINVHDEQREKSSEIAPVGPVVQDNDSDPKM